jgi:hypothetical protein
MRNSCKQDLGGGGRCTTFSLPQPKWYAGSLATLFSLLQDTHIVGWQVGYPIVIIFRMTTWWAGELYTLLPLVAGCPHGLSASWLPHCHYFWDDYMMGRQDGYPFATIYMIPKWWTGKLTTILPLYAGYLCGVPTGWLPYCHYLQDAHVVCREQAGYPIATICRMPTCCAGSRLATLLPLFAGCPRGVPTGWLPYCHYLQDAHVVCRQQAGYPIATICRMPTWCAGSRLATLLPLFAGCPRGVPAGWLPYCHYLQDAHVVCRQAGYPIATICRMPT